MIGKNVKCDTCKNIYLLDESPWCACTVYPIDIPNEIYQNYLDSEQPIKCKEYEFNPNWNKD